MPKPVDARPFYKLCVSRGCLRLDLPASGPELSFPLLLALIGYNALSLANGSTSTTLQLLVNIARFRSSTTAERKREFRSRMEQLFARFPTLSDVSFVRSLD